ncbi:hypothetical protein F5Y11DRAFT_363194 [Daldinia sp. FL1419]|nr:hypothetical protein F5Y11DRAFT_363194 [Daldinia sp. FL1419]
MSTSIGRNTQYFTKVHLPNHCMLLGEFSSEEEYGELRLTTDGEVALEKDPDGTFYNAERGFCILAVQDRIYNFLVRFCETVLHDIPPQALMTENNRSFINTPAGLSLKTDPPGHKTIANFLLEDQYSPMSDFD